MDSLGTTSPQTCAAVVLVTESKVGVPGTCGMMWAMLGDDVIDGTFKKTWSKHWGKGKTHGNLLEKNITYYTTIF